VRYLEMDRKGVIRESVNGIHMSQDRVQWRRLVNMVPWSSSQRQYLKFRAKSNGVQ
jgi:hypothetical protein